MTNELETVKNEVAITPDYMNKFKADGADDITADIIEKSFLSMAHEDKDSAKKGEFYDSATGQSFGESVVVTVCRIKQTWRKFDSDFKLVASSENGYIWDNGDAFSEDEKWKCAFIDMFVILNNNPELPLIMSFKGTSYRTGKKLSTAIAKFVKGNSEPIFARNYTLYTEEAKKGSKTYTIAHYKINSGFNTEEVVTQAAKIRKMVIDINPVMTEISDSEADDEAQFNVSGLD
tara:strand:- start:2657 stop:3355 length:699 start_codon:yes stop_codon:yes gene_type:complete